MNISYPGEDEGAGREEEASSSSRLDTKSVIKNNTNPDFPSPASNRRPRDTSQTLP